MTWGQASVRMALRSQEEAVRLEEISRREQQRPLETSISGGSEEGTGAKFLPSNSFPSGNSFNTK